MNRASRRALLALAAAAVAVATNGCGSDPPPAVSSSAPPPSLSASPSAAAELTNLFENAMLSIGYPDGWDQQDQESGALLLAPDRVAVVSVQVAVWRKPLARLVDPALDIEQGSVTGFELLDQTTGSLDGADAIQFTYTGTTSGGTRSRATALWAVSGDRAYRVSFRAAEDSFASLQPVAQAMFESFQIL